MKLNSAAIKQAIVAYCQDPANAARVKAEFDPPLSATDYAPVLDVRNWKRMLKQRYDDLQGTTGWLRVFDCRPMDDMLRAEVVTDPADQQIIELVVQGE